MLLSIIKILFLFLLGTIFWSFWSVLVFRLMKFQYASDSEKIKILKSIFFWRSYCLNCWTKLKFFDLIPIFSFLLNKWKCRYCKTRISSVYFWLEVISGLIFVFVYVLLSKFYVEDVNFRIFYFWFTIYLWLFWLLVVGDFLYYYLIEALWIVWFLWTIFWLFLGIGNFKVWFYWGILFLSFFLFIYLFSKFYVKLRFKKENLEGIGFWDVMVGFILWLGLGYIYKISFFDIENIVFYFLVYIILSSFIWLVVAWIIFLYNKIFKSQTIWWSIPFLPPMFFAYISLIIFIVFKFKIF